MFPVIKKQLGGSAFLKDGIEEYLKIEFMQKNANWYKPAGAGRFVYKKFPAKQCTKEDFGSRK